MKKKITEKKRQKKDQKNKKKITDRIFTANAKDGF